ncbi:MAG TPA: hypothetical protein VMJ11_23785 [Paraburkholderia sp.]|uniref:hypothetical protein n=1 Tax=Paraburkholderia sp. TaxID=1926495 RepID=UPI002BDA7808|nr:hypothetical protein [Paraburkholderia sp.]HTR09620.1 hypothetical protein [Paraburkholderia sp.]
MNDQPENREPPDDTADPRHGDHPRPIGDALPIPTEPGLDQPLPPKTHHEAPSEKPGERPDDSAKAPSGEISRPLGDAVPTPAEPGLDQPLPAKKTS